MTTRDVATITLRALAAWWIANGTAGLCSALLTWHHAVGQNGAMASTLAAAASGIYIPIGAVAWLIADWVAARALRDGVAPVQSSVDRAGLYAFASVLVGLFLLSDALPQLVYWIVVWRMSRGTAFWSAPSEGAIGNSFAYWVAGRAQIGAVAAKLVLGLLLVSGPERIKAGVLRIRREFSDHIADEPRAEAQREENHHGA